MAKSKKRGAKAGATAKKVTRKDSRKRKASKSVLKFRSDGTFISPIARASYSDPECEEIRNWVFAHIPARPIGDTTPISALGWGEQELRDFAEQFNATASSMGVEPINVEEFCTEVAGGTVGDIIEFICREACPADGAE
jgi:hypothetical protein